MPTVGEDFSFFIFTFVGSDAPVEDGIYYFSACTHVVVAAPMILAVLLMICNYSLSTFVPSHLEM